MNDNNDMPMPNTDREMIAVLGAAIVCLLQNEGLNRSSENVNRALQHWNEQRR